MPARLALERAPVGPGQDDLGRLPVDPGRAQQPRKRRSRPACLRDGTLLPLQAGRRGAQLGAAMAGALEHDHERAPRHLDEIGQGHDRGRRDRAADPQPPAGRVDLRHGEVLAAEMRGGGHAVLAEGRQRSRVVADVRPVAGPADATVGSRWGSILVLDKFDRHTRKYTSALCDRQDSNPLHQLDWGIPAPSPPLPLTGHTLTPAGVADVAHAGRTVTIAPAARARIASARTALERALAEGRLVYGLTTGLGARVGRPDSARARPRAVGPDHPRPRDRGRRAAAEPRRCARRCSCG